MPTYICTRLRLVSNLQISEITCKFEIGELVSNLAGKFGPANSLLIYSQIWICADTLGTRVVYRFGIFCRYSVGISQYLPNRYRRKTRSVHFGIIIMAGTPFFSKGGSRPPFLGAQPPFWGKKGFLLNLKEFPPNSLVLKIPTEIPTDQFQSKTISLSGSFQYIENYDHNTQWHSLYKF